MSGIKSILNIFACTLLIIAVWFTIYFSGLIISKTYNENLLFIPKNAYFALRIDGRKISETTFFSVLLDSKDEEILNLFSDVLNKGTTGEKQFKNTGINIFSDFVFFKINRDGLELNGILFNLLNPEAFEMNIGSTLSSSQTLLVRDRTGLILSATDSGISKERLRQISKSILQKKTTPHQFKHLNHSNESLFAELHFHKSVYGGSAKQFHDLDLKFDQQGSAFSLDGTMNILEQFKEHELSHKLQSKGFHLTSRIFAKEWADSIKSLLKFLPVELPEIRAFSLNYEGVNVINHSSGFFVLPQMELIIQCAEEFSIKELVESGNLQTELDYKLVNGSIFIQEEQLFYRQLSPRSFYIGRSNNPVLSEVDENVIFEIDGKLEHLVNIKGGGLMTAFLEMLPIFKASKELARSSEGINLRVERLSPSKCEVKGEMIFKESKLPMTEVMRFMLLGQVLN